LLKFDDELGGGSRTCAGPGTLRYSWRPRPFRMCDKNDTLTNKASNNQHAAAVGSVNAALHVTPS
jgi:hypothetical protein